MSVLELRNAIGCQLQYFSFAKSRRKHLQLKFKMRVIFIFILKGLVCRYHYFRGMCCFLCVPTLRQLCCITACLILQKWKPSCYSNSSKYETIICICMCPLVLRGFFWCWGGGGGGVCRQSKYKGFCVLKLRITKKHVMSAAPCSYFGGCNEM